MIPKGTVIFPNMRSVSRDPEVWQNPDEFDPTRYLDENGHYKKQATDFYLPFGAGKLTLYRTTAIQSPTV